MKYKSFPFLVNGRINWYFGYPTDHKQAIPPDGKNPYGVEPDPDHLLLALEVLFNHELLIPTYVELKGRISFGEPPISYSKEIDFDFNEMKNYIFTELKKRIENIKAGEINTIGGYGIVIDENNQKVISDRIVSLEFAGGFHDFFSVRTKKSIWVPISIDTDHSYVWQFELWQNNASRLTAALKEIQEKTKLIVSPAADEICKEEVLWMKGFELFNSPEVMIDPVRNIPENIEFSTEKYFDYYLNGSPEKPTFSYKNKPDSAYEAKHTEANSTSPSIPISESQLNYQKFEHQERLVITLDAQITLTLVRVPGEKEWKVIKTTVQKYPPLSEIVARLPEQYR